MQAEYVNIVTRAQSPGRGLYDQSVGVSDTHARYQEAVLRGNVYFAANQAVVSFSTGLTTVTAVGLIVSNPPNSNKNLVMLQAEVASASAVAGVIGLSVSPYSATALTHTTGLTVRNALGGSSIGTVANADSGATIPAAPVVWKVIFSMLSTNTGLGGNQTVYDIGGSLILPPGTGVAVLASAALTGWASLTWEEVPTNA